MVWKFSSHPSAQKIVAIKKKILSVGSAFVVFCSVSHGERFPCDILRFLDSGTWFGWLINGLERAILEEKF